MNNELEEVEIEVVKLEDIKLEVKKYELPKLIDSNYEMIKEQLETYLDEFKENEYTDETIDVAKNDKATLNNLSKAIDEKRKSEKKKYLEPFDEFEKKCNELKTLVDNQSNEIKAITDTYDKKQQEIRRNIVSDLFNSLVGELKELITLDMVFDEKWLNKGSFNDNNEFKLTKELEDKLNKIRTDLSTIESLKSEHELTLKSQYLKDFNLGNAIVENNRLNELKANTQKVEVAKEEIRQEKVEEMITKPVETEEIDPIKTYTLEITGTSNQYKEVFDYLEVNKMEKQVHIKITGKLSQQKKLRQLLDLSKIQYEKVE